jgi:hypothetical protein
LLTAFTLKLYNDLTHGYIALMLVQYLCGMRPLGYVALVGRIFYSIRYLPANK